jgi:heme exporter protein D
MNWNSASEFLDMGGHGFFVWGSYTVCLVLMIVEPLLAARRRRQAMRQAEDTRPDPIDRDEEDA